MEIQLGENIRKLRRESGLTQEQLAEALGVTPGAVHKWETGKATPELEMLVDLAQFFETSVDAMLNYGWEKLSMGQTAEKIEAYRNQRDLEEGIRFAEGALRKYPNSFEVTYQSAMLYFISCILNPRETARRAITLFEACLALIDQNPYDSVNTVSIQNNIAGCYCYLNEMDKAIEILKKNNVGGMNDGKIGLLMSQNPERAEESLKYLSTALYNSYARIYEVCIGYANAYGALERLDKIEDLMQWLLGMSEGLKLPDAVNIIDKADVRIYTILAEVRLLQKDEAGAERWLREAKRTALRFDAAPQYRSAYGMKYYHSSETAMSYDDMGETGMAMIENYMAEDVTTRNLRPLWAKIQGEDGISTDTQES